MKKSFLVSAAAVALLATTTLAGAQGMDKGGGAGAAPAATPPAASTAPTGAGAAPGASPGGAMNRGDAPAARGGSEIRSEGAKPDAMRPADRAQRDGAEPGQRAQDNVRDNQPDRARQDNARDMMQDRNQNRAQDNNAKQPNATTADDRKGGEARTTGQAGAGAKITSEQRTQITTVIKQQNVRPVTNVNFNVSVGTRVPRGGGVTFHTLPQPVLAIYPEWRGYEYFLVGDEIVVVDPRTLEIVAVLPA